MRYLIITEYEETSTVSSIIKGLSPTELTRLERQFATNCINYSKQTDYVEVSAQGVVVLTTVSKDLNYRVVGQSMLIEETNIGGRIVQVQRIVWTLEEQVVKENI